MIEPVVQTQIDSIFDPLETTTDEHIETLFGY